MDNELKQEFVRRIAAGNRSELIVVLYDMADCYLNLAEEARQKQNWQEFKRQIELAENVVRRLIEDLNFEYEIAKELFRLYSYCQVELAKEKVVRKGEGIANAGMVLKNLYPGICGMAKADQSPPMMENAQKVVTGMTYNKTNLTDALEDPNASRGFLA